MEKSHSFELLKKAFFLFISFVISEHVGRIFTNWSDQSLPYDMCVFSAPQQFVSQHLMIYAVFSFTNVSLPWRLGESVVNRFWRLE